MLTIAHRLNTVLHSDRIVVLDRGTVVECDTPDRLQAAGGVFASMLAQARSSHGPHAVSLPDPVADGPSLTVDGSGPSTVVAATDTVAESTA